MKQRLLFGLLLVYCCSTWGQNQSAFILLRIVLKDSASLTPIHFADIQIHPFAERIDDNQINTYKIIANTPYELHINHFDCEHKDLNIQFHTDTTLIVLLRHSEHTFSNFTLKQKQDKQSQQVINSSQINQNKGQPIAYLMEQMSGVQLLKSGQNVAKPMVNGLYGNRVILLNDFSRLEGQNWGLDHAPELDAHLYQTIKLIQGANTLRYGPDGFGAMIQLTPISVFKPKTTQPEGNIQMSGISNGWGYQLHAHLGSLLSKQMPIYWQLSVSNKQIGNYRSSQDRLSNTAQNESQIGLQLGYKNKHLSIEALYAYFNSSIGLYRGAHVSNSTDLTQAILAERPLYTSKLDYQIDPPKQRVDHSFLQLKLKHQTKIGLIEHVLSRQFNYRREFDIPRSSNAYQGPSIQYYLNTIQYTGVWQGKQIKHWPIQVGFNGKQQSNAYSGVYFIPGYQYYNTAGFALIEHDKDRWHHEASVRYDWQAYSIYTFFNNGSQTHRPQQNDWSYVWLSRYQISPRKSLQMSIGKQWRMPGPNELYSNGLHQSLASFEQGDSTLLSESGHFIKLLHHYQSHALNIESEMYYLNINHYIQLNPSNQILQTIRGPYPVFKYQQTDAQLFGLNGSIKWQLNKANQINYQLSLPFGMNKQKQWLNYFPSPSHKLSGVHKFKTMTIEVWAKHVQEQKHYQLANDLLPPPKAYTIYGLNIQYPYTLNKHTVDFGLSVSNLFNLNYRDYLNRLRYFIPEPGINVAFKIIYHL